MLIAELFSKRDKSYHTFSLEKVNSAPGNTARCHLEDNFNRCHLDQNFNISLTLVSKKKKKKKKKAIRRDGKSLDQTAISKFGVFQSDILKYRKRAK